VLAALVAAGLSATAAASAAPARVLAPAALDFSFTEGGPHQNIELGAQQGDPVCTGPATDQTCVMRIGTSVTSSWTTGIKDNGTGAAGALHGSCAVMYSGTTTSYTSRPGHSDATGSEDCSLEFDFGSGDLAVGSMHEQRVLENNLETNTFTLTITSGTGRFAGLNSVLTHTETNPWQASPPIGVHENVQGQQGGSNQQGCNAPQGCPSNQQPATTTPKSGTTTSALGEIRRLAVRHATPAKTAAGSKKAGGAAEHMVLKPSAKPIADITSLGLLAPANAPSKVAVTASAGSSCSGAITGPRTIELPRTTIAAGSKATILRALPAGTFTAKATWKLDVTCKNAAGVTTTVARTLKGFTVLKK